MSRILFVCLVSFFLSVLGAHSVSAQSFEQFFEDATLRVDYVFSGDASRQSIALDEVLSLPSWNGRRLNLDQLSAHGNGQIEVRDHASSRIIYCNSFSTLFQEWLTYPEAKSCSRAFQHVALVPMPRDTVDVAITLYDNHQQVIARHDATINPSDILVRRIGANPYPCETIVRAADSLRCVKIAIVGDGYTADEMPQFVDDARHASDAIFAHEPFASRKADFNVVAVKAPSPESGTSVPREKLWRRTLLGSHFDTFYSDRYLTTLNIKDLHNALAGTPYDHIIIIVNTSVYGGGGIFNFYNLSAAHNHYSLPVIVHEFGHSFAGLADEYAYMHEVLDVHPLDIEPWEPNITTRVDKRSKWKDVSGASFVEGAGYRLKGIFRAFPNCRMRDNETRDFCPVCQHAISRTIDWHVK